MPRKATPAISVDRNWEAEDALRTLTRAKEIEANAKLMRDVKSLAKKQHDHLGKIAGTKGRS
jgi:hypothetical protein